MLPDVPFLTTTSTCDSAGLVPACSVLNKVTVVSIVKGLKQNFADETYQMYFRENSVTVQKATDDDTERQLVHKRANAIRGRVIFAIFFSSRPSSLKLGRPKL